MYMALVSKKGKLSVVPVRTAMKGTGYRCVIRDLAQYSSSGMGWFAKPYVRNQIIMYYQNRIGEIAKLDKRRCWRILSVFDSKDEAQCQKIREFIAANAF